jgi:hypothetical protein
MVLGSVTIPRLATTALSTTHSRSTSHLFIRSFSLTLTTNSKKKMPPKKAVAAEKVRLGKVSNNLKIGESTIPVS